MNNTYKYILCLLLIGISFHQSAAQERTIHLENLLEQAEKQTISVKRAKTNLAISSAEYQLYKANLRPTIGLDALLPNFINTSTQVTQPDGSIAFQRVSQNNSSLSLYANQNIGLTGANVFVQSDLQRFDNFSTDIKQYNGVPFRIGIVQPLFAFNPLKWQKRILPLRLKEQTYAYNIAVEDAKWQTSQLFFDIIGAKTLKDIAQTNKEVNENLLLIAQQRFELGKTSENEVLQLEMELKRAILTEAQAGNQEAQAIQALETFLNTQQLSSKDFVLPEAPAQRIIDMDQLILKAKENRPEIIQYQRELLEQKRQLASTRSDYGIQSNVLALFGWARGSENIEDIYQNPFNEQQIRFNISVPIYDGGKRREAMKIARLNQELIETTNQQNLLNLENEIRNAAMRFIQAQQDILILEEIKSLATDRFDISNQRYTLGKISITELTLAQREKDQIHRDYVSALRNYWTSLYQLRTLTGEAL